MGWRERSGVMVMFAEPPKAGSAFAAEFRCDEGTGLARRVAAAT